MIARERVWPCGDEVQVRPMHFADLAAVEEVEHRTYDQPWPTAMFAEQMTRSTGLCLVAECEGRIVGYLISDLFIDVWHIMNVCVDAPFRRRRFATRLLESLIAIAGLRPHHGLTLEVRTSNLAAQALYRRLGFVATGVRPGYYTNDGEDAISMWRDWNPEVT